MTAPPRIERWVPHQFLARLPEAMAIYTVAMGYPASSGAGRARAAAGHSRLAGFVCRAALTAEGQLVGFGYGYLSRPGQWWHDLAHQAVTPEIAALWFDDAFELSELHVLPAYQGHGLGRQLVLELAAETTAQVMLLSTPDADTRAFRLYHSLGFVDLARGHVFPGDTRPFALLGRVLPLARPGAEAGSRPYA